MARSAAIWAATDENRVAVAVFTVKHECITFLQHHQLAENVVWIAKYPDGMTWRQTPQPLPVWSKQTFLEENVK